MTDENKNNQETDQQDTDDQQQDDQTPNTDDATGKNGGDGDGKDQKTFTQAELDAIVKERLDREKKKQQEKALAEQQRFEELAQQRAQKLAELEPQLEQTNSQAERYKAALEAHLTAQKDPLAEHILTLLEKMDPVDQLEYISTNREALFPRTNGDSKGGGVDPTPKGKGDGNVTDEERRKKAVSAKSYY